jgi:hypothetical protein
VKCSSVSLSFAIEQGPYVVPVLPDCGVSDVTEAIYAGHIFQNLPLNRYRGFIKLFLG